MTVGGELDASMLELQYDTTGRIYQAPLQVKANNGMMLIDDFGRQVLTPQQLLNRWIYPLSKRKDYLTLTNGQKFAMPFELMVAFSTNMDPNDLGDEAFFRRIQNKVYVGPMTPPMFDRILETCVKKAGVHLNPNSFELLRETCMSRDAIGLRANYPWDFCKMIRSIAEYEESMPVLDERMLGMAAELYWGAMDAKVDARRVVVPPVPHRPRRLPPRPRRPPPRRLLLPPRPLRLPLPRLPLPLLLLRRRSLRRPLRHRRWRRIRRHPTSSTAWCRSRRRGRRPPRSSPGSTRPRCGTPSRGSSPISSRPSPRRARSDRTEPQPTCASSDLRRVGPAPRRTGAAADLSRSRPARQNSPTCPSGQPGEATTESPASVSSWASVRSVAGACPS